MLRIFAALVLSLITALNTIAVPCKAEETRHITIQFDGGGATAGNMETITLNDGNSAMAIPENKFERSGYMFSHWYITDGSNTYTALDSAIPHDFVARQGDYWSDYAKNSNTLTLIAQWECIVSDDYYEITVPTNIKLKQNGSKYSNTIDVSATAHQRKWINVKVKSATDFNFVGKQSNSKVPYTLSETSFEMQPQYPLSVDDAESKRSITVSTNSIDAKVSDDYSDTVTFEVSNVYDTRTIVLDCNGGSTSGKSEVNYTVRDGSSYGKLPVPTKTNYSFLAWQDEDGNTIYSGSTVSPNTERLTAKWLLNCVFAVTASIDGRGNEYLKTIGTFDTFRNGIQMGYQTTSLWYNGTEGQVWKCNNFNIDKNLKYTGYSTNVTCTDPSFSVLTNDDGTLNEINYVMGTIGNYSTFTINLHFVSNTPLQQIINANGVTTVVADADKPAEQKESVGVLDNWCTEPVDTYVDGTTLHLYNQNGGRIVSPVDSTELFASTNVDTLDLNNLDVSNVVNATQMFAKSVKLKKLIIDQWDTSKMTNMAYMFYNCAILNSLHVEDWNTSNVRSMEYTFCYSKNIPSLDLNKWDVSKVTNFLYTFFNCSGLTELNISKWSTDSATNMTWMFQACSKLKKLDVSNFKTGKVTAMARIFQSMSSCTEIVGYENWDVSKIRVSEYIFSNVGLSEIDISKWKLQDIRNTYRMFYGSKNLKTIYVSEGSFSMTSTVDSRFMFLNCNNLQGGMGTAYDPTFIDATAARIDGGPNSPGYFTNIADKPNSVATQALVADDDPIVSNEDASQNEEYELSEEELSYYSEDNIPPADTLPGWQAEYSE